MKNTQTITTKKSNKTRLTITAMVMMALMTAVMLLPTTAFAFGGNAEAVMRQVVQIIGQVAVYVGGAIGVWGIFQAIMAFRREDSEGVSKQITSIIVGCVLCAFGLSVGSLFDLVTGGTGGGNTGP